MSRLWIAGVLLAACASPSGTSRAAPRAAGPQPAGAPAPHEADGTGCPAPSIAAPGPALVDPIGDAVPAVDEVDSLVFEHRAGTWGCSPCGRFASRLAVDLATGAWSRLACPHAPHATALEHAEGRPAPDDLADVRDEYARLSIAGFQACGYDAGIQALVIVRRDGTRMAFRLERSECQGGYPSIAGGRELEYAISRIVDPSAP